MMRLMNESGEFEKCLFSGTSQGFHNNFKFAFIFLLPLFLLRLNLPQNYIALKRDNYTCN